MKVFHSFELGKSRQPAQRAPSQLRARLGEGCQVIIPGDEHYDAARRAWHLSVDQYPALIVVAQTAPDIAETIRFAGTENLQIAVTGAGHGVRRTETAWSTGCARCIHLK